MPITHLPRLLGHYGPKATSDLSQAFASDTKALISRPKRLAEPVVHNSSIPRDRARLLTALATYLEGLRGQEILYYPTPGNGGDCVIQVGVYQALRRAGVSFRPINVDDDVTDRIVMLGGGANLTPLYGELRHVLIERGFLEKCARLIILPHTIRGNEDLLQLMDKRVTIFCRDPETYVHVQRHARTSDVHLDHDMALHIDLDQFHRDTAGYTDAPGLFDELISKTGHVFEEGDRTTVRSFFRTDGERPEHRNVPPDNLDISLTFELGTWPENSHKAVWCFFEAIRRSGHVLTDRLHVGIAASLLDQSCSMYDNSYGKNRTIYLHSIRKYAPASMLEFIAAD